MVLPLDFPKENFPAEDLSVDAVGVLGSTKRELEIKARYDAQLIAHERTERKLEDAEKQLEQEREKNSQLRAELMKGIEIEKEQKERIQEEMGKVKENNMKEELKYTKQIQDLELQVVNLENERLSLIV